jgi:UDP-N-acetylmuramate dehydrogenase
MPATFEHHVSLSPLTTFGVGGPARSFVCAETEADLIEAVDDCEEPLFILGGGSNLLVSDEGFDGRVVRVATRGIEVRREGEVAHLTASAGEPWDALVEFAVDDSLAGLECLSGIPGLVGATPIQNVGAYGQEVSDTITRVRVWDRVARRVAHLTPGECAFGYRDSVFKREARDRYLVLDVTFTLRVGVVTAPRYGELSRALDARAGAPSLREIRSTVITLRRAKSMVLDPQDPDARSAGSFFVNPVVSAETANEVEARARALGAMRDDEGMPRFAAEGGRVKLAAGWLIERAGVSKGTRLGRAAVSRRHSLALVNLGDATAREVVALAKVVRSTVSDRLGVTLTPEPVMVGFGTSDPLA